MCSPTRVYTPKHTQKTKGPVLEIARARARRARGRGLSCACLYRYLASPAPSPVHPRSVCMSPPLLHAPFPVPPLSPAMHPLLQGGGMGEAADGGKCPLHPLPLPSPAPPPPLSPPIPPPGSQLGPGGGGGGEFPVLLYFVPLVTTLPSPLARLSSPLVNSPYPTCPTCPPRPAPELPCPDRQSASHACSLRASCPRAPPDCRPSSFRKHKSKIDSPKGQESMPWRPGFSAASSLLCVWWFL